MSDAREVAVRRFRQELEDNRGFTAGEMAMLVETYDRAFSDGIRHARDAAMGTMADPAVSTSPAALGVVGAVAAIDGL